MFGPHTIIDTTRRVKLGLNNDNVSYSNFKVYIDSMLVQSFSYNNSPTSSRIHFVVEKDYGDITFASY